MDEETTEVNLFSLNAIRDMQVIDINEGRMLGTIYDLKINCDTYKILSIFLVKDKPKIFGNNDLIEIPCENIIKIGTDVIIVKCDDKIIFE